MSDSPPNSFRSRWSSDLEVLGYTSVPNCLITCQVQLGITSSELNVLLQVLSFKYDTRMPFPSLGSMAKQSGLAVGTIRRNLRSLENKGLISRITREGLTNCFDVTPLILRLEAHPNCKGVQKRTPPQSDSFALPQSNIDAKQDELKSEELNNTVRRLKSSDDISEILKNF